MSETDIDSPDWYELRAARLENNQQLRCVQKPPISEGEVEAEALVTNRIKELRELSETYQKNSVSQ